MTLQPPCVCVCVCVCVCSGCLQAGACAACAGCSLLCRPSRPGPSPDARTRSAFIEEAPRTRDARRAAHPASALAPLWEHASPHRCALHALRRRVRESSEMAVARAVRGPKPKCRRRRSTAHGARHSLPLRHHLPCALQVKLSSRPPAVISPGPAPPELLQRRSCL